MCVGVGKGFFLLGSFVFGEFLERLDSNQGKVIFFVLCHFPLLLCLLMLFIFFLFT